MLLKIDPKDALGQLAISRARDDLGAWARLLWGELNPGHRLVWEPHMSAICEHLQAVFDGTLDRIGIAIPPGTGKTTLASYAAPLWYWGHRPEWRMFFGGWSKPNIMRDQRIRLQITRSGLMQAVFPRWQSVGILPGSRGVGYFTNTVEGVMRGTTVQATGMTGGHADCQFVDDPLPGNGDVGAATRTAENWWYGVMSTRYRDPAHDRLVGIQQRICADDLMGIWLARGHLQAYICLPAEYDPEIDPGPTPLGWTDPRRVKGELLSSRLGRDVLAAKRSGLGPIRYNAQYQQTTCSADASRFKPDWWRTYTTLPPGRPDSIVGVWDTSEGLTDDSDFTVGQVWHRYGADCYLVEQLRARMETHILTREALAFCRRHPEAHWYVEKKSTGASLIKHLVGAGVHVTPWLSYQHKIQRIVGCVPYVEAGFIRLPTGLVGTSDLIAEATAYPLSRYDDQLDALAMMVSVEQDALSLALTPPEAPTGAAPPPPARRRSKVPGVY